MISYREGDARFQLRAAAVIRRGAAVLLHRIEGAGEWILPGGRVEMGEAAAHTVVREMREELGEAVHCAELLWLVENFFQHGGVASHEIGLYFAVQLAPASRLLHTAGPYWGVEGDKRLEFAWFEPGQFATITIQPAFLREALALPEGGLRHVVQRDVP